MTKEEARRRDDGDPVRATAGFAAALFDAVESDAFLQVLHEGLLGWVGYDNFIVFAYRQGFAADLLFTNLDSEALRREMAPYTAGLYLLDPFYIADTAQRRSGLMRLDDVAPADFDQSEFYLRFYAAVDVLDELHYVVPLEEGRSVHVFIERERPHAKFDAAEAGRFEALSALVAGALRRHWSWRDRAIARTSSTRIESTGGVEGVIRNMAGGGQLTRREVEVIALLLRGHAAKRIAHDLDISESTVTNHKRNVYEKLAVHSQGQLFSLFLKALSG